MRRFLDANVLYSTLRSYGGRALALFRLADFNSLLKTLEIILGAPLKLVTWAGGHGLSGNDAPVLAAAVVGRTDLIVTGDRRNFGGLFGREFGGVEVVSLGEALAGLLGSDGE